MLPHVINVSIHLFPFCSVPRHDPEHSLLKFWPFPGLPIGTHHSVMPRYSWILLPWQRWGRLVCRSGVRPAFLRWHWLDNVSVSTPPHTHTHTKEAISVEPPTPCCRPTYGRYYIAYRVLEASGSTIYTVHLRGTCRDTARLQRCKVYANEQFLH